MLLCEVLLGRILSKVQFHGKFYQTLSRGLVGACIPVSLCAESVQKTRPHLSKQDAFPPASRLQASCFPAMRPPRLDDGEQA